ncbi:hypothetical protein MAR_030885 [Mya arenaria]|uniref:Uncharacterized protein n=1 Tax=Mya arenaria TaxID=6604 RepID=A0ABY7F5H6_MYAAR|nr:hypothetical protein MAR_030885 [Mya arenaria]
MIMYSNNGNTERNHSSDSAESMKVVMTAHRSVIAAMFPRERNFHKDYRGEKLPTRFVPTMEFEVDKRDYSVAEFHETFQDNLPRIVMVSQGFCGEITEDTFDREMVRVDGLARCASTILITVFT